jgi:surface antigen
VCCTDIWGFCKNNCTSYVAYKLNNTFQNDIVVFNNSYNNNSGKSINWHDASNWKAAANAVGIRVDNIPSVGSVAWWDLGTYGHVAYVESVNSDNTVNISEYNNDPPYGCKFGTRSNISAQYYIHVFGTNSSSSVPDTGQTKCYDVSGSVITCPSPGQAFYGQDANYTINPMSYTKLDGSGNTLPDSSTSWVTVRDNVTGLIWEVKTNKDGVKNYNNPHDADNTYTWYDSNPTTNGGYAGTPGNGTDTEDFIKALNSAKYGGYSDWRLPTIKELDSIVNLDIPYPEPTINTTYFPNTVSSFYWSSTTRADNTSSAWGVWFQHGMGSSYYKSDYYYGRAVRGGQSQTAYVNNNNGTITDTSTGLMWQRDTPDNTMTWEQALSYCENLNLAGYTDWRLPTRKELRSLVDYSRYYPAINTTYFPDTISSFYYWSSTTHAFSTGQAWGVHFDIGIDSFFGVYVKSYDNYVRAVRGGQGGGGGTTSIPLVFSNSVGPLNTIKITDRSGSLPATGGVVAVKAWGDSGKVILESPVVTPLKLYNYGTTFISGSDLAKRFPGAIFYDLIVDSSKMLITNVKNSTDCTLNIPISYSRGISNFVSNSIGPRNTIKITDMSGSLPASGGAISVRAWDASGYELTKSWAAPKLYNHGTTGIAGSTLQSLYPTGMTFEFSITSSKALITNVKNSSDGSINIPSAYTIGLSNYVSNSIGAHNTLYISDLSGSLSNSGVAIGVNIWDASGNQLHGTLYTSPFKLYNHGTTIISGAELAALCPYGSPMTYEFSIASSKVLITNVKHSVDGTINIPSVYTNGTTMFATNFVSPFNTIKISDMSGTLPPGDAWQFSVKAWDAFGNAISESGSAPSLIVYSHGTKTVSGSDLENRFPGGIPALYEFSHVSSSELVTNLTVSTDGTVKIPTIFTTGTSGGM